MRRIIGVLVAALLLVAGCGTEVNTAADKTALLYQGGFGDDQVFKECIGPSSQDWHGFGDTAYEYPTGQRTYDFTGAAGSERGPIKVTDKDGVTLEVPGVATFVLDTNCEQLRRFHETIGIKYSAWGSKGWLNMLNAYMGNPLDKAMDQASQAYTWRQLLNDPEIRDDWEASVGALARRFHNDQAGFDFLCSPTFAGEAECGDFALTIQKPVPPESISTALAETAAEVERTNQAREAQNRINTEAASLAALVDVLGPEAAVLYQAMKDGHIEVMPVPVGSSFLVNPPGSTE